MLELTEAGQKWLKMHTTEHVTNPKAFSGRHAWQYIPEVRRMVMGLGMAGCSVLDYGSGKGHSWERFRDGEGLMMAEAMMVGDVTLYDPGYEPVSKRPEGEFDMVFCTDVMEHIPEPDVQGVLRDIFGYARRAVFFGISISPACGKILNGIDPHCTVKPPEWWKVEIEEAGMSKPGVVYSAQFMRITNGETYSG